MPTTAASEPILYFLAGALLPTIAYVLLNNKSQRTPENDNNDDGGWESDDDDWEDNDDDDENDDTATPVVDDDPRKWGLRNAPYKMVLCVNTSLKMGKGKIAAQCGHAALGAYRRAVKATPSGVRAWDRTGSAKIAVKIENANDMQAIAQRAIRRGIPVYLVEDAGRTQIAAGSRTVLGLGPAPVAAFDGITDHLKLM